MRVLGVLAGEDMSEALGERWCASADLIYAADGGADRVDRYGFQPSIIVGDMDSVQGRHTESNWMHDASEDFTDCDKLLQVAANRGHTSITLIGTEGNQLDHTLAALHSAARAKLRVRLALRTGIGWVLGAGQSVTVSTHPGRRVSLLPLTQCSGTNLSGVRWPLADATLDALGSGSISNEAETDAITASLALGAAFLFVGYTDDELPYWPDTE